VAATSETPAPACEYLNVVVIFPVGGNEIVTPVALNDGCDELTTFTIAPSERP
jgi:hypothetical protein